MARSKRRYRRGRRLERTADVVLRPSGLAGLGMVIGAGLVVWSMLRPWWRVRATLDLGSGSQTRPLSEVLGYEVVPWGWAAAAGALVVLVLGVLLTIKRQPDVSRPVALAAAGIVFVATLIAVVTTPSLDDFPDPDDAVSQMRSVGDELPTGMEVRMRRGPSHGTTLAVAGSLLAGVCTLAARDLQRR